MNIKKILVITPKFPLPASGACEQERLAGLKQFKRLGYDVRVIAKVFDWQNKEEIGQWGEDNEIKIDLLDYKFTKSDRWLKKFFNPLNWDGAAYEYKLPDTQKFVEQTISEWNPDIVWFDYTYLWPLYHLCQKRRIPIITRSINFEPIHFLQEDGASFKNLLKFLPKVASEIITIKKNNFIFAITPKEEKIYRKMGAKKIAILPLRSLPSLLKDERQVKDGPVLHLFFMGAAYTVPHIKKAGEFVIKEIAPELEKKAPGKFMFHILGKKLPEDLQKHCGVNVKEEGYVPDLDKFLDEMDIAVIPSLLGAGMQQKIFEPLVLGIPTVTSPRGIADYPFKDSKHVLLAKTKDEYVGAIIKMQDVELRKKLSENSLALCKEIFSQKKLDEIVLRGLNFIKEK